MFFHFHFPTFCTLSAQNISQLFISDKYVLLILSGCKTKTMMLKCKHHIKKGKHIWGFSNILWQCVFYRAARVHRYEWAMWCLCASVCVCSLSPALIGLDSCTGVCGKHRWLLLLLLPPDLCDLLHKDNRAVSYPHDPLSPRPKNSQAWRLRQRTSSLRAVW